LIDGICQKTGVKLNQILIKRIIKLIAINYALNENELYKIYEHYGSIDSVLNMIQEGEIK